MTVNFIFVLSFLALCTKFNAVQPLNILGIFPYQGKSHFFVFKPFLEELAHRGHNVTVISHFPRNQPLKNYHDISLAGKVEILEDVFPLQRSYWTIIQISFFLVNSGTENCRILLEDENVQNLWKSETKFDVIVLEQFNSDCSHGLAHKLGAPVVGMTSHILMPWLYKRFGIPYNPSYVSFEFLEGGTKPTLYQRVERTIFDAYFNFIYKLMSQRVDENTLAQYFDDMPPLEELARNMKFMIIYTNFILTGSNLYPPNVIEVNGYHVAKPKPLPEYLNLAGICDFVHVDRNTIFGAMTEKFMPLCSPRSQKSHQSIQNLFSTHLTPFEKLLRLFVFPTDAKAKLKDLRKFIEESEHGVIYISFGSMLKAAITPRDKIDAILGALSKLPQRVIWKWEEKTLPGNPKNIYLSSWLPQNDILAHPKVMAFYSHCGLLGTTEAMHHGVPIVAMPIFGDQPANAAAVEESGLGVQIQLPELSSELLLEKFKTVLNHNFRSRVKMLSKAWRDRPVTAMDSAIYWTEFAARYSNFTFRAAAADVPLYQYLCLDVLAVLVSIFMIIIFCLKALISLTLSKSVKLKGE